MYNKPHIYKTEKISKRFFCVYLVILSIHMYVLFPIFTKSEEVVKVRTVEILNDSNLYYIYIFLEDGRVILSESTWYNRTPIYDLKSRNIYKITTCGINFPKLGFYKNLIEVVYHG